jgi:carbamoyl-phosphate synthase large subunit
VIVQFGGQTPLKLASHALQEAGIPILGTPSRAIDLAEDRDRFLPCSTSLGIRQAASRVRRRVPSSDQGERNRLPGRAAPVLRARRPRDGDRHAMTTTCASSQPRRFGIRRCLRCFIDRYLSDATEVDVDAICDGENVHVAGIMEHIEEAGIHSGDSACALPPIHAVPETFRNWPSKPSRLHALKVVA